MRKVSLSIALLFSALTLPLSVFASHKMVNVKALQKELRDSRAQWIASENHLTGLSRLEFKRMLGSLEQPRGPVDYSDAYNNSFTYEALDWRNREGVNWLGDVMNQGNCGSCVAFAAVATVEATASIAAKFPWLKPNLSPEALFACGGGACNRGWYPSSAASYIKRSGLIDSACAPYTMGATGKDVSCKQFCPDQSARVFKVTKSFAPSGGFGTSAAAVKEALKKGPLMTTMTVYADFISYKSGIYKSISNESVGGHAVSLVGYNDSERYWIVRNSWGADWGEAGYVRVSWDDKSGIASSNIGFEIPTKNNYVTVMMPDNSYVSGVMDVKAQFGRDDNFQITIRKPGSTFAASLPCQKSEQTECLASFDTAGMAEGKYEVFASSESDAQLKSMIKSFVVINSTPVMSANFKPSGFSMEQPLKGRVEFDVTTTSAPVPMQTLEFLVVDSSQRVVARKLYDVVLPAMKLGFRTNSLPNGQYEIFFRGSLPSEGKTYSVDSTHHRVTFKN
ncbi:MAG: hypothetical protein A2X86_21345 [Bdellovibrionales bacterium GWA2_49_15]|nr:MAG: hypothetical protein A2X86_21345 [Bdellovibrionales bacterium GWA2_49_15]HAZ14925.1 hypothetical protein [Bdellovibrionales bacterium]